MYFPLVLFLLVLLSSCKENNNEEKKPFNAPEGKYSVLSTQNENKSERSVNRISDSQEAETGETTLKKKNTDLSPKERLLSRLEKDAKIQYAQPDYQVLENDTIIQSKDQVFEIKYTTACLNDSLVAQELIDIDHKSKFYLISHNYSTSIAIKVNGKHSPKKTIRKEIFAGKLDLDFLNKSIIKHPAFVRFDDQSNEAVFSFMIGVPNTDWLVLAGINMNQTGEIRVIDVVSPEM